MLHACPKHRQRNNNTTARDSSRAVSVFPPSCARLVAMSESFTKSLQGQLLIAAPTLQDPNFLQSVVLIVQHDEEGALGLILNRPTDMSIGEAWEQVCDTPYVSSDHLYHGGPCQGPLMVVHTHEEVSQVDVAKDVFFSTDKEHVEWLIKENLDHIRFFVGYAGWSAGQLDAEMETGSWLTLPATSEHVFSNNASLWQSLTREIALADVYDGIDPKARPIDPNMN